MRWLPTLLLALAVSACSPTMYGAKVINSDPEGAFVLGAGYEDWGKTPTVRGTKGEKGACKDFVVNVKLRGYLDSKVPLRICNKYSTPEQALRAPDAKLMVVLEPVPVPRVVEFHKVQEKVERYSEVDVSSNPEGASVFVDGRYIGVAGRKVKFVWLPADDRKELRFEMPGYLPGTRLITPMDTQVHMVLQPTSAQAR